MRRHAKLLVAGQVGVGDGHGERHARLVFVGPPVELRQMLIDGGEVRR
jgi:hypothetical protein